MAIATLGAVFMAPAAASAADEPCNGAVELCSRTLDQVVLPGTHNSMSASELGWSIPNQTYSISHQLDMGVRAFLYDTHYGAPNGQGQIVGISKSDGRLVHAHTYLCHELCQLGATDLTEELHRIAEWLAANPREVLTFINEDGISPEDYATAVTDSGLLPYVYTGSVSSYPTLGQMIDSNQRVVMFAEQESAGVSWYHNAYDGNVMETPYTFLANEANPDGGLNDPAQLNDTCRPNRGSDPSPLFLMNHWASNNGGIGFPEKASLSNARNVIVDRARACETRRGKLPNIIAVDFFGQGDLIGAVRELNGVTKPILAVGKVKAATVKAKRKATFKLSVSNSGDATSDAVKVCAKVPAGLGRNPGCSTIPSLQQGTTGSATLKVLTKKRFRKGSGVVRFTLTAGDQALSTSAKLIVKPLKKPKRHRKA